ncbi:triose-phosphate isomerase, partial [Candidatus Woesearchaeota archaeon]|nr:triose-phosphate isomerase [Candidatus Woesearchaeota archaeon]
MRKVMIAANWKMNKTVEESLQFIKEFKGSVINSDNEIVIAPPFTALSEVKKAISGTKIILAAQNMNENDDGAFTGEISPVMLKEFCQYIILGHSERRQYYDEDDTLINNKLNAALKHSIKVILCVGETLEQRENNKTTRIIEEQIKNCLKDIPENEMENMVIAYEPVWAIGTGKTATKEQAEEAHKFIRGLLSKLYNSSISNKTRILYGGSVKPANIQEL